jgi:hypothetical protein
MIELVILAILGAGAIIYFGSQDLGLRTWVAGSQWSWSLWPVPPQKRLSERCRTDTVLPVNKTRNVIERTDTTSDFIYKTSGYPVHNAPLRSPSPGSKP